MTISAIMLLFSLSGVSAANYSITNSNTTTQIQSVIDSDLAINLVYGTYSLIQININRSNVSIIDQSKSNVIISGTGTLFNITASNVKIINLTIRNFNTGIIANKSSNLTITNNYIDTTNSSIIITTVAGNNLNRISIENNTIISAAITSNYGSIIINIPYNAGVIVDTTFLNNNITATSNSPVFRIDIQDSSSNLTFINKNITSLDVNVFVNVYIYLSNSNNTNITFTNNNITSTSRGVYLGVSSNNNSNVIFTNNNITSLSNYGVFWKHQCTH